jgi:hypothetical protein
MSDEVLIYRGSDLIVSSDLILDSVDAASLLINSAPILNGFAATNFTNALNLNSGSATPVTLTFDATNQQNNMTSSIIKQSTTVYQVLEAGVYLIQCVLNVTPSSSSVNIHVVKNASVNIISSNLTSSDGSTTFSNIVSFAANDLFSIQSFKGSGSNNNAKVLLGNSSCLIIRKLF